MSANVITTVVIKHASLVTSKGVTDKLVRVAGQKHEAVNGLVDALAGFLGGSQLGRVSVSVEANTVGDRASQTVVCDQSALTADETLQIGNVTLTWKASAANENQVAIGANDIASAANLAAAINVHTGLLGIVTAASDGVNTVTITSALPGRIGEMIGLIATQASTGMVLGAANLAGITGTSAAVVRDHVFGVA